jgi:hypothetical protein
VQPFGNSSISKLLLIDCQLNWRVSRVSHSFQLFYLAWRIPPRRCLTCSEYNPQSAKRGGFFSSSRGELTKTLAPQKSHSQWSSNKVVKRMVLGSDVGLEDTCKLALCRPGGEIRLWKPV